MSDERLRALERRWREGGSVADEAAYLAERVRAGELTPRRLDLVARLGHPAARVARGLEPLAEVAGGVSPEVARFLKRLAETIVWCEERAGRDYDFRTHSIARSFGERLCERRRPPVDHIDWLPLWTRELARNREEILVRGGWVEGAAARDLCRGRLLLFDPNQTLSDGAAEVYSGGFYDAENLPAWDSWVAFVHRPATPPSRRSTAYLVCWIPEWHVSVAEEGIRVNAEDCIQWASAAVTHGGLSWPEIVQDPFMQEVARIGLV